MNPSTMSLPTLLTLARAHAIPIPHQDQMHSPTQTESLRKALFRHPKWGSHPRVRFMLIPEDDAHPIRNFELERVPLGKLDGDLKRVLGSGCREYVEEFVWSDDWAEYVREADSPSRLSDFDLPGSSRLKVVQWALALAASTPPTNALWIPEPLRADARSTDVPATCLVGATCTVISS